MRRAFLSIFCISLALVSCNNQKKEANTTTLGLNKDIVKKLGIPSTVVYIGLDKPQDTTINTPSNLSLPEGMVLVPGGVCFIGSKEGFEHEAPRFWIKVKPFFMDKDLVTVADFRKFIKATAYKTEAEKFGNAGIIHPSTDRQWILKDKATWEYPLGPDFPKASDNHPVTQVSWNDATAYAQWAGKRLPSELEWEHAARNGNNSQTLYSWGNDIENKGKYKANVWQGKFPDYNTNTDSFSETSPVGQFGRSPLGLSDMSGNVWQWTSNYKFNYLALFQEGDMTNAISNEKAERGGSFLCEPGWCHGYRVSGRSSSTPETSLFHVGFRCIKDL
jgi:formylglycine-generating enzyme